MLGFYTAKAALSFREVTEDDFEDVDDAAGEGGIVITGLGSAQAGHASKLLAQLVAAHGHQKIAVVAYAASGDHERLYRLYGRFGFVQQGCYGSLLVRDAG